MKRKTGVLFFVVLFSLALQACGKDEYVPDIHKRDDIISKQFDMIRCEKEYGTVCVETTDEELARDVVKKIDDALKEIDLQPNKSERQTIYVMDTVPALSVNAVDENVIFADCDKVVSGDAAYLVQELIYRYYDCDYWISYGLSHRNDEVDSDELSGYYANPDNWRQLQLYGTHFFEMFQDAEQCRIAKDTAVSVIRDICGSKNKITKELVSKIESGKESYINSWLESLGVPGDFKVNPELTEEHLTFYSLEDTLFCIILENIIIQIDGSPYNSTCVRNLEEIDEYFSYTQQDAGDLNAFVENNDILGEMVDCGEKRVCYKYESAGEKSRSDKETQTIELATWDPLIHEIVHQYLTGFGKR